MHYLFARTNNETNILGLYFLSTRRYLGQLFKSYGNLVISYISMNINIRNKISFFEVHWDMNMQFRYVIKSTITPFGCYRIWSRDQLQFISQCTSKFVKYDYIIFHWVTCILKSVFFPYCFYVREKEWSYEN